MSEKDWGVYLVYCADETYYCGVTKNINKRIKDHNNGLGAKYTRYRLPVKLIAFYDMLSKKEAYKLEYKIKRLKKHKKSEFLCKLTQNRKLY